METKKIELIKAKKPYLKLSKHIINYNKVFIVLLY